ncbi:MAG TPA: Amuc_1100 family pilus-like protein [Verrucomicrobiae bacterium]|jgi:hypothetical protein
MGWIKRNLFFVIGGAIALVLLGASGFYIYQGWSLNSEKAGKLDELYQTLKTLGDKPLGPGLGGTNTAIAKRQDRQLRDWIASTSGYFQVIAPIPASGVTDETFAAALRRTIGQLQKEAAAASVLLPPQYSFSFEAEGGAARQMVRFSPEGLAPLAAQLGEVKTISEIVFSAQVNSLDAIQRVKVSADDLSGAAGDYIDETPITNDLVVVTPYVVTFHGFTPELARVISAFAASKNALIIKAINVSPAGAAGSDVMTPDMQPGMRPSLPPGSPGGYYPPNRGYLPPGTTFPAAMNKGGLQTILKEQLLRITVEVEIVKLLPKS